MKKRMGATARLRLFFAKHVGEILNTQEIREAAGGVGQYGRRMRELKEEGYEIASCNDLPELKSDQYKVLKVPDKPVRREKGVSKKLRAQVLHRDGYTCKMCGVLAGQIHPYNGKRAVLHAGQIVDRSLGGRTELGNLRAECGPCNEGSRNLIRVQPSAEQILAPLRPARADVQRVVFEWLLNRLDEEVKPKESKRPEGPMFKEPVADPMAVVSLLREIVRMGEVEGASPLTNGAATRSDLAKALADLSRRAKEMLG